MWHVLLCYGSFVVLSTAMTLVPLGCHKDGKFYAEGEKFQSSPCSPCFCSFRKVVCAIVDCAMPMCVDAVHDPTKCCAQCPNGRNCYAGDKIIPAGQAVAINNHTTCKCPERFGFGMNVLHATCAIKVN